MPRSCRRSLRRTSTLPGVPTVVAPAPAVGAAAPAAHPGLAGHPVAADDPDYEVTGAAGMPSTVRQLRVHTRGRPNATLAGSTRPGSRWPASATARFADAPTLTRSPARWPRWSLSPGERPTPPCRLARKVSLE